MSKQPQAGAGIDRRTFLAAGGMGLAAAVIGPTLLGVERPGRAGARADFVEPPLLRSEGGVLSTRLRMATATHRVGERELTMASYEGSLPGPTLRFRGGETLRIRLENQMQPLGVPTDGPLPPGFDPAMQLYTNVHTHGLQVSPVDPADNVFRDVLPAPSPDSVWQYEYQVPKDQPAGLHWYHPHRHGATTHQGWQGLAGALIVEGDIDRVPEVAAARERLLVLSELWVGDDDSVPTALVVPNAGFSPFTSIPAVPTDILLTINGVHQPAIPIQPGETQRWRVLASGPHRFFWLSVEGHTLYQIGQDGVPFAQARPVSRILLAPGNRAEFILKGGPPGSYRIRAEAYDQGHPGGPRPERLLGTLESGGARRDDPLPGRLVDPPVMPGPVVRHRKLVFSGDISGRVTPRVRFFIDGQEFDPFRVDQRVEVGTVEEWTLVNQDVFQHPFHIHVNPFQVVDIQGASPLDPTWVYDPTIWWDVFRMPPKGSITFRTYFRPDVTGLTVYHCHILPHEDNGMMGTVCLDRNGTVDCTPKGIHVGPHGGGHMGHG